MTTFDDISVEISVVLGQAEMPIHQLLRMGRGGVIGLDAHESDDVLILANKTPIARGQVMVIGEKVGVRITEVLERGPEVRPEALDAII
ncbi:FliM/FliN family flagellar motor switch protein [Polycladidibacter hongkongensis]|uniref:FliM/FliN family flagellar motor switch protein n=1 Tax=Polycladidibacter hongkongensis TaxID=1647556 RepID=UPI00082AF31C|nr:FliM/FliN family flagellar motor switch protein [Pseudovibrio hongkongensis]